MKTKALILILLISSTALFGQKVKLAKADKQYDKYAYIDAIEIYERVANKGFKSTDLFQKLGNSYYFNAELDQAAKWYGELFALGQDVDPEYYYRYSQSLKSIGEYDKANEMLSQFNLKKADDTRGKRYEQQKNYLQVIDANSGRYDIENAGAINSKFSDYGSAFYQDQLIFASARDTGGLSNKKHEWTNQSFTNLYGAKVSSNGNLETPEKFAKNINSKYHESTPIFTKDGKTMYFTRNNYTNGKKGKDDKKTTLLKLYKSTLEGEKWSKEVELPFNSDNYSVAHPALSPDDKTLYFASDMPGTIGLSDIFKVSVDGDSYGTPENLGPSINTEGRETFPFISEENEMYFASDGHLGLGGLDIFVSKMEEDGAFKDVHNVGAPINGKDDDFAFLIDTASNYGFFTSNRDGGQGYDDIYKFKEKVKLPYKCEQTLEGVAIDEATGLVIPNAQVTLLDNDMKQIEQKFANEVGKYSFKVECDKTYTIRINAEKDGFTPNEKTTKTPKTNGKTFVEVPLVKKAPTKVGEDDDIAKALGIPIIYFDLDKYNIRPDAAVQLALVLEVMNDNPTMTIDVRSHTDCRQTQAYNMWLSDKRAKSTIAWLVKNGINKKRLTGKGYGESQLVNDCGCEPTNESSCSEEQHQKNRRSEFKIVKM